MEKHPSTPVAKKTVVEQAYQCPACKESVTLPPEALAHSAVFCPTCRIHRPTADFVPVPVGHTAKHERHDADV